MTKNREMVKHIMTHPHKRVSIVKSLKNNLERHGKIIAGI